MFRAAAFCLLSALPALAQETTTSHGISAFGDLKYPADFAHFDYADPEAPKGGTMSFRGTGASSTFDSLNAFILAGEPAQGLVLLYDTLLEPALDEPDAAYGLLAESVEYPPDRSWAIFTLRPGVRFADGSPVTAEDVVWTVQTLRAQGLPQYAIMLSGVEQVEALDERRVRFAFVGGPASRDLAATVGALEILPKHYYESRDFARSTLEPPLGSGPYVVDRVQPGRSIRYCRNPDYWGADLPVNRGKNNFDCYVYEYFADYTAAFEAFKVGQYLFHEEFSSAIWGTSYDFPAVREGWILLDEPDDRRPAGTQGFWLNLRRPHLQDVRVREALAMMFNFEWSNATLFHGLYERTDSFWENSPMQAEGLPQGEELAVLERHRELLPPEVFTEPAYVPPVWGEQPTDRRAVRQASALLDAAGWEVGADGLRRNAAGQVLSLEILDDSPTFERIALPYVENLRRIGVDARFTLIDSAQFQQRQEDFDYDTTAGRLVMSMSPSVELRTLFGSSSAGAPGTLNLAGVADPAVDALIEEIVAATTREEMEARVKALDRVLRAMQIWVPNWHKGSHWLAYWDVFGRPAIKPDYERGTDFWWWDEGKYQALKAKGAL